jgi:hypothetical protein
MALTIFEKNLEVLSYTYSSIYERVKKKIASENLTYGDFPFTFEQRCQGSANTDESVSIQSDIVITYGFGTNSYFLEELIKKNSSAFILVFESSALFFYLAFN